MDTGPREVGAVSKIQIAGDKALIAHLVRTIPKGTGCRCVRAREEQEAARVIMEGGPCLEEYLVQ